MLQAKYFLTTPHHFFPAISLLLVLPPCTLASNRPPSKPLVTPITKDPSTSLYTVPIKNNAPLVLDLAGPLMWSTCPYDHRTFPCHSRVCAIASRYHPPNCPNNGGDRLGSNGSYCKCTAYPYNPVTGQCASGDLTRMPLSANATDGKNPLYPVSFSAIASCAPDNLLASLPAGSIGVAGLGRSPLALPAQVASSQKVEKKFALCLPSGGIGVAVLGGGPFYLLPPWLPEITATLAYTPLLKNPKNPAYYIHVKGIAINSLQVPLPRHALHLDNRHGGSGGVVVCTRLPYTALRSEIYRQFVKAFDEATSSIPKTLPPVAPFELCYDTQALPSTRLGYAVPPIDLMLEGGKNWTVFGGNSMVQVNERTACLAFVEMKGTAAGGGEPAIVIGGFQMENNLLLFDVEKGELGFSSLLWGRQTTCSNFNFTTSQ